MGRNGYREILQALVQLGRVGLPPLLEGSDYELTQLDPVVVRGILGESTHALLECTQFWVVLEYFAQHDVLFVSALYRVLDATLQVSQRTKEVLLVRTE